MFTDANSPVRQLLFTTEVVAAYLVGAKFNGLTNSYMTPEQRANLDPNSEEYQNRVWGSKIQVIGWSLYAAILWGLKICIAAVYQRLTYVYQRLWALYLFLLWVYADIRYKELESPTLRFAYDWHMVFSQQPT